MNAADPAPAAAQSRACIGLEIPPGPGGLDVLMPALAAAMDGTGPAIALLPGSGSTAYRAMVRHAVVPGEPVPPEVAVVTATSGSTGHPAGVLLPGSALRAAALGFAQRTGRPEGHRWVAALPLHHAGGLMVAARSVVAGTDPIAVASLGGASRFSAAAFEQATMAALELSAQDHRPLAVSLVPPMLALLAATNSIGAELLCEYDVVLVGGAPAPRDLVEDLTDAGVCLATSYGMTETCGGVAFNGRALEGVTIEAEPDGRLAVTGAQVALGYRDRRDARHWQPGPAGTRMFRTGDLGTIDAEGIVSVEGRVDDVVQVAGASVSLSAIRSVLTADPEVGSAEVVALPDLHWGSRIVAAVVPVFAERVLRGPEVARALADEVENALGRPARPRDIHMVPSLPVMESGKVDRAAVRTWALGIERGRTGPSS